MVDAGLAKRLASRRFIITILGLGLSALMTWEGILNPENFETLFIWLTGIYVLGKPFGDLVGTFLARKE